MNSNQQSFIDNLKFYRSKSKISQARLAELCEVSTGTIGNIECGKAKPSFDLIFKIAEVLEIPVTVLFESPSDKKEENQPSKLSDEQKSFISLSLANAISETLKSL